MARNHSDINEKHALYSKMCFATFCVFGVNPITENLPVFLQLIEAIWKTAANPGETYLQSCAETYDGVSVLYRMKFDLVFNTKDINDCPYL